MSAGNVLVASGICKALGAGAGRVAAVSDLSLTLRRGEVTLLMGPSGSGKSTLLGILGCMMAPDSGTVEIEGAHVATRPEAARAAVRRRHIGYVFQSFNLFPGMTALQNVELGLSVRGCPASERRERAHAALEAVQLDHKASALPVELSGGQQQRVAIARAIVGDTSIILADEPTAALDSETGARVLSILRGLATGSRRAVLLVAHDHRITRYADRLVHMLDGRVVADEPIADRANAGQAREGTR